MTTLAQSGKSQRDPGERDPNCLEIGLVNNMPGPAMQATERQFHTLLDAAADGIPVRLTLFALPDVPRTHGEKRFIHNNYFSTSDLWDRHYDGLIVTGAEPLASSLKDEPYWASLTKLMDWAEHNTHSSIWSCLAAHAAALHMDGVERRQFAEKLCGVFECSRVTNNPVGAGLTAGIADRSPVPHSRWNDLPAAVLDACGYDALIRSQTTGIDAFVKQRKNLFVFLQGHPEYENDSLLLEYRRDIRRFLKGERDSYPSMPVNYLSAEDTTVLNRVQDRVLRDREAGYESQLLTDFPAARLSATIKNTWRPVAIAFYRNWLRYLSEQKAAHHKSGVRKRSASEVKYGQRNCAQPRAIGLAQLTDAATQPAISLTADMGGEHSERGTLEIL